MQDVQQLIDEYRRDGEHWTEQRRATAEAKISSVIGTSDAFVGRQRDRLHAALGVSGIAAHRRLTILRLGEAATPLWSRMEIEGDLSLSSASQIAQELLVANEAPTARDTEQLLSSYLKNSSLERGAMSDDEQHKIEEYKNSSTAWTEHQRADAEAALRALVCGRGTGPWEERLSEILGVGVHGLKERAAVRALDVEAAEILWQAGLPSRAACNIARKARLSLDVKDSIVKQLQEHQRDSVLDVPDEAKRRIAEYERASSLWTERQRAKAEVELWDLVRGCYKRDGETHGRRTPLAKLLGVSSDSLECRAQLYNLGAAAVPLWDRMEQAKDLTLEGAIRVIRRARSRSQTNDRTLIECVEEVLSEPVGTQRKPVRVQPQEQEVVVGTRAVWGHIKKLIMDDFAFRLRDMSDTMLADTLSKRFECDLKVLLDQYQSKISHAASQGRDHNKKVNERKVPEACRTLCMATFKDDPDPKKRADPAARLKALDKYLARARLQKKRLTRAYHPDLHGGGGSPERYQAVLEAYDLIENYIDRKRAAEAPQGEANG
jgi:hypothetical protein